MVYSRSRIGKRKFKCSTCGKYFQNLWQHQTIHWPKVECEYCGQLFQYLSIKSHLKSACKELHQLIAKNVNNQSTSAEFNDLKIGNIVLADIINRIDSRAPMQIENLPVKKRTVFMCIDNNNTQNNNTITILQPDQINAVTPNTVPLSFNNETIPFNNNDRSEHSDSQIEILNGLGLRKKQSEPQLRQVHVMELMSRNQRVLRSNNANWCGCIICLKSSQCQKEKYEVRKKMQNYGRFFQEKRSEEKLRSK